MKSFIISLVVFLLRSSSLMASDIVYTLSSTSEDYNTKYFYCKTLNQQINDDQILHVEAELPSSFVMEIGALDIGGETTIVYNGTKSLRVTKKRGRYKIGGTLTLNSFKGEKKLSFYFVNDKLIIYVDDTLIYNKKLIINKNKKIGVKFSANSKHTNHFLVCYEPIPFVVSDYGKEFEHNFIPEKSSLRVVKENVGKDYSLNTNSIITCNSSYSTRFEYQFQDSKEEGKTSTQKSRSEIAGVCSFSPMNKWIIEFDVYIPSETKDDNENFELITQIHEGSTKPTTPAFYLAMLGGYLKYNLRGDSTRIEEWDTKVQPSSRCSANLSYLEKNRWHHIKVYIKESYLIDLQPLTKIWVDDSLLLETDAPNCYCYEPRIEGRYGYFKFGIYKPGWMTLNGCDPLLAKRVYYFDNIVVRN